MATSKRKSNRGAAPSTRTTVLAAAPQPAASINDRPARQQAVASSLQAEQAALGQRRLLIGALVALGVIGAALVAFALMANRPAPAVAPAPTAANIAATAIPAVAASTAAPAIVAPTVIPTVAAPAVVAPTAAAAVVAPTAAAAVVAPTAAAAVVAPTAAAAPQAGAPATVAATCVAIAGMPVFAGAACTDYDMDEDDGVIKHQNTYTSSATVDEVRRFYEAAFASNGWVVAEFEQDVEDNTWEYTVAQQLRQVKVKVEPQLTAAGTVTEITIDED